MLDDIMLFVHLVECGSFKKAAELQGLQQPTISKHLANLEKKLGKRLLIRDTRNISITEEGKFIYDRFKHLNGYVSNTINNLSNKSVPSDLHGTLNVSLASTLSYELICPFVERFTQQYPDIKINLFFQSHDVRWNERNLNFALTMHPVRGKGLDHRFMRMETTRLYCRPEYVTKYGTPQTITDLANHRTIGILDPNDQPVNFIKMVNNKNKQEFLLDLADTKLKVNSLLHMKKLGISSDYIFGSWESLCAKEVNNGTLVHILPEWESYSTFYLTSKKSVSLLEQKFIDFIYECMGYFL